MDDIVAFITAQLNEDEQVAREACDRDSGGWFFGDKWNVYREEDLTPEDDEDTHDLVVYGNVKSQSQHIARHDPARVLREVAVKWGIIRLHTTGSYRTYQCGNHDHIQEWQCERAGEPYTEHRYCEVCGNGCAELPLLASLYANRQGFKPEWVPDPAV